MAYLISYRKASDQHTDYTLVAPEGSIELCSIDGITYVAIPDGEVLQEQFSQIAGSVKQATLTTQLRAEIMIRSVHIDLITKKIGEKIRERYSIDDELYYARIAGGVALGMYSFESGEVEELEAYKTYVENIRTWGRQERAKLGL